MFEVGRLVARLTLEGAQNFGRELRAVGQEWRGLSDEGRQAATEVGRSSLAIGAGITALVGVTIAKSAQFEQAMSAVQAATMASASTMGELREAALEAGEDTAYSAEEAAGAIETLSKAGVGAKDIIGGGLSGALALAAAGEVDVAVAAETAATALTQFNLAGSDVPHVADLLAAGAGKAQGGVEDMAMALKQGGLVASQMGLSIEETTGTLAAFASAGLIGSDAGTSFRTMLLSLANPSNEARELMESLGIAAYDTQGNFVGMEALAGQLQARLGGLSQAERDAALATIFGSDAIRAANVLYKEGAEGVQEWTAAVDDSGYAAQQAAARQNNLAGDVEKLGGALDTLFIRMGEGAQGPLRELVQGVTFLVDAFAGLPAPIQGTILTAGALTGGVLLLAGAFLTGIPKVAEFRASMQTLRTEMPRTASAARALHGPLGVGLGAALAVGIAAMSLWIQRQQEIASTAREVQDSLDQTTGEFTDYSREIVSAKLAEAGAYEVAAREGIKQREVLDAVMEGGEKLDALQARFAGRNNFVDFFNGSGIAAGNAHRSIDELREGLERAQQNFEDQGAAAEGSTSGTDAATAAYEANADALDTLTTELDGLIEKISEANGVGQDAITANIAYQDALAQVDEQIQKARDGVEGYSLGVDTNTEAGRQNVGMLVDLAEKAESAARKQFELDGNTENYRATLEKSRDALIKRAEDLGYNSDEARKLADQILRIPDSTEWEAIAKTRAAQEAVDRFITRNSGRVITLTTLVNVPGRRSTVGSASGDFGFGADGGFAEMYADGGFHERHDAQFARAGAWRVWAEPETGGEAYIPLSPAKRGRSTAVLAEVAEMFGLRLAERSEQGRTMVREGDRYDIQLPIYAQPEQDPTTIARQASRELVARLEATRR